MKNYGICSSANFQLTVWWFSRLLILLIGGALAFIELCRLSFRYPKLHLRRFRTWTLSSSNVRQNLWEVTPFPPFWAQLFLVRTVRMVWLTATACRAADLRPTASTCPAQFRTLMSIPRQLLQHIVSVQYQYIRGAESRENASSKQPTDAHRRNSFRDRWERTDLSTVSQSNVSRRCVILPSSCTSRVNRLTHEPFCPYLDLAFSILQLLITLQTKTSNHVGRRRRMARVSRSYPTKLRKFSEKYSRFLSLFFPKFLSCFVANMFPEFWAQRIKLFFHKLRYCKLVQWNSFSVCGIEL